MLTKTVTLMRLIIQSMWNLATGWNLPGFNFNFAELVFFILFFGLVLKVFFTMLGIFGVDTHKKEK